MYINFRLTVRLFVALYSSLVAHLVFLWLREGAGHIVFLHYEIATAVVLFNGEFSLFLKKWSLNKIMKTCEDGNSKQQEQESGRGGVF